MCVGEDNLQAWTNPTQTDRNWQNTVIMAYQSSPHLAFYVYYRYIKSSSFIIVTIIILLYH